ncbi:TetR/AcrR family transcriptional regulator [Actinomadura xylanilytica]|uniref:TetR/AcrR family transcriptional regulator n=1 Tax=Actinomadura xylanilytica TaxID=887459 RepID=UPI00255AE6C0|nr:TetR/AcrR family transcriptional regulator [Actinomadura xylanilytica]MDL4773193.1 TetR/AcrR family transcriptional regulator [Actinomadura xylanilytica]
MSTKRTTRRDWVEAAYDELVRSGERGIAINGLAARLGVTKGSFYWHFDDRADLVQAILDRWGNERTDEMLGLRLGSTADPRERLRRIQALAREVAPIDRAMRLWAQHDEQVADAVRRADRSLLRHVGECLGGLGFGPADAVLRGHLMLRVWVGGYLVDAQDGAADDDHEAVLSLLLQPTRPV